MEHKNYSTQVEVAEERPTEVSRALSKLNKVIEGANISFSNIRSRITPVLNGGLPKKTSATDIVEKNPSSQLAQEIESTVAKINFLVEEMNDVYSQIEL